MNAFPITNVPSRYRSTSTLGTVSTELRNTRTELEDISEEESLEEFNAAEIDAQELENFHLQFRMTGKQSIAHRKLSVPDLEKIHQEQARKLMEAHYSSKVLGSNESIPELHMHIRAKSLSSIGSISEDFISFISFTTTSAAAITGSANDIVDIQDESDTKRCCGDEQSCCCCSKNKGCCACCSQGCCLCGSDTCCATCCCSCNQGCCSKGCCSSPRGCLSV